MARPQKKGLDYFPLDVNFYGDIKVRKLMRNNGGGKAAFVYVALLCKIYENGYYMEWDDDVSFMLSDISGFEEGMVRETVKSCLKFGLFDQKLFEENHILTSPSIQMRYFGAVKRRVAKLNLLPYVYADLIPDSEFLHTETDDKRGFLHTETEFMHTETGLMSTESTQKKRKEKNKPSLRSGLLPSSPPTTSRAREDFSNQNSRNEHGEEVSVDRKVLLPEFLRTETDDKRGFLHTETGLMSTETKFLRTETPDEEVTIFAAEASELLKKDNFWLLQMQRRHGIHVTSINAWLDAFVVECDCRGKSVHLSLRDYMAHFNDWLKFQLKDRQPKKQSKEYYQAVWTRCQAELSLSIGSNEAVKDFFKIRFNDYKCENHEIVLTVPDEAFSTKVEDLYGDALKKVLRQRFGRFRLTWYFDIRSFGLQKKD